MPFIIPSIFTAVDKFSPTVAKMGTTLTAFEQKLSIAQATSERSFRRHTNIFSNSSKSMFDYAKSALAVGATIGGIAFTGKSIADYEDAVASFRTIVSDLNNVQFSKFEQQIGIVARETKKSTIDVAQSFEKIAGLNPVFASTAEGLATMSSAAITLAKASRMDLGEAAESLTGIMNQFNFEATQANRTINVLAAGQAVGAASINQTATALTKFGSTAKASNVSLEQSVALVELFAEKGFFAEDAGFKLNSGILKLQAASLGYKSGTFNLIDALTELKKKYDGLGSSVAKDAYLQKVFDITQINTGRILLENIDKINATTAAVTGTSEATKAAEINANTLSNRLDELKNRWITIFTTSNTASKGLNVVKRTVVFLTNNLEGLITVGTAIVGVYAAWWSINKVIWAIRGAYMAWNFVIGVNTALQGKSLIALGLNEAAIAGYTAAANTAAGATAFWNSSLAATAGYIGVIVAGLVYVNSKMNEWNNKTNLQKEIENKNSFMNTRPTPIYTSLISKGYTPEQIDSIAESGYGSKISINNSDASPISKYSNAKNNGDVNKTLNAILDTLQNSGIKIDVNNNATNANVSVSRNGNNQPNIGSTSY